MKIKTWQYIVIGLLVLGAVGLIVLMAWLTPYDLKKEQAAARAAGLPLTNAELVRPKPPASQDAGPDWLALSEYLEKHPLDTRALESSIGRNGGLPAEAVPEVRRFLRERADVVARIHGAAAKPHAYFEHSYSPAELFPHYAKMREAAKVLRWESLLLAHEGKYAEAVRAQELGLNIADQLAEEPILIGMLVSLAVHAIGTRGMEDMLDEAGPNAHVATLVEQALRRHPVQTSTADALKGETLFGLNAIQLLRSPAQLPALFGASGGSTTPAVPGPPNPLFRRFFLEPSEAAYLHWMTRYYEAARHPMPQRAAALKQATGDADKAARLKSPAMILTKMVIPTFANVDTRNTSGFARHAVALAAAAVMEHRGRTGQWPKSLASVAPQPPADPFTGKPLGYRREGSGFVVFSAGESGTFAAKPGQSEKGEALFRYPRPALPSAPAKAGLPPAPGGPPALEQAP